MTWYFYDNYGSMLQVFALTQAIKREGYAPFVVRYLPKAEKKWTLRRIITGVHHRIIYCGQQPYISDNQKKKFSYFRSLLEYTPSCNTHEELSALNTIMDAFVCGSDQIWSPLSFDENYFLSFVEEPEKMIAYAPSIGVMKIENEFVQEQMRRQILRFKYLSVREEQGAELIHDLSGQTAKVVLDPTLLFTADEWNEMLELEKVSDLPSHYILCYFLGNNQEYMFHVQRIAQATKLPVVLIPTRRIWQLHLEGVQLYYAGPIEFAAAVKSASYVCTDSFHGLAFSVIFGKQFCCYERFAEGAKNNQNGRIYNLLLKLDLMDRLYRAERMEMWWDEIDYCPVWQKLAMLREDSAGYLREALAEAAEY